jgi:hypothetical protein
MNSERLYVDPHYFPEFGRDHLVQHLFELLLPYFRAQLKRSPSNYIVQFIIVHG